MKFSEVVDNIARVNDLKRIAKAHLYDVSRLEVEQLRAGIVEKMEQYCSSNALKAALGTAVLEEDRDVRTIAPILLGEVLLQEKDCAMPANILEDAVIDWEQSIIDANIEGKSSLRKIHNFEFFKFVLEAAWENDGEISRDEKNLIEKIRGKLQISEKEYRLVEAELKQFPKAGNEVHQRDDINKVRNYLQENGLLLTFRNSAGEDCDVIPEEMIQGLRLAFGVQIRDFGYRKLLGHRAVRSRSYLEDVLQKCGLSLLPGLRVPELQELCVEHVKPRVLLGGLTPRDGLEKNVLEGWCRELGLNVSGLKEDLISRVIEHYDGLIERPSNEVDPRKQWFDYFEKFAERDYDFLRSQELISKDLDVERRFEEATSYLFESFLGHKPLEQAGSEKADGALAIGAGVLFWDNKSKESVCDLKKHLSQFDRYFAKSEKDVAGLLVVAPDFSPESHDDAIAHEIQTGNKLILISAAELKEVALRWASSVNKDDPFPLRYFKMTGRFRSQVLDPLFK